MPASKGSKKQKSGAGKGTDSAARGTERKKAGTRVNTEANVRGEGTKKGGGDGSRNKLRDGTR